MQITKILKTWLIILTCFGFLINSALVAQAQLEKADTPWLDAVMNNGLQQTGETAYNTTKPKDVRTIVVDLIEIILGLLGIIFVVLMIIGGFRWMTSQGNEEKVTSAKKLLLTASIGLLIILASFAITRYVASRIIQATTNNIPGWHIGG
ncbi:MAG: pilin [bacterium]